MSDMYNTLEQSERVKNWLRENGSAIVMGLVLSFGLMYGYKQWQQWETSKRQQASAEYQVLVSFLELDKMDAAVPNYQVLKSEYPKSAYTAMASLMMAKARLQAGQVDLAARALTHAMENAQPAPVRLIARERLARVRLSQGDSLAALQLIDAASSDEGFESQFAEIRGDIHRANGATEQAIESYRTSLELLEDGIGNRQFLIMKLEALGAGGDVAGGNADSDGGEM